MTSSYPLKQILIDTIQSWDHEGTPENVRRNFWKIINCGTAALLQFMPRQPSRKSSINTCKSRFCPSCGARAASIWQEELESVLPNMPYVEINFTMPRPFWALLQQNRHLLNDLPSLGAAAIGFWARARYGARVILMVVQQTYGGFLNLYPHLHTLVSAGGLDESGGQWIPRVDFRKREHKHELMLAWRYALLTYLHAAVKANLVRSDLSNDEMVIGFEIEGKRNWNIFGGRWCPKGPW